MVSSGLLGFLIGLFLYLQIKRTYITALMGLNFGQILLDIFNSLLSLSLLLARAIN